MTRRFWLGVDGGNSKTEAVVLDHTGEVLGRSRFGTGDIYNPLGESAAVQEVLNSVFAVLDAAQISASEVVGAAFCLAGVDWPEDEEFWSCVIANALPELKNVGVVNDAVSGLYAADGAGRGVAIMAGTAGAVAARGLDGAEWVMSFWNQDELGAIGLTKAAYRAIVLADLGVGEPTQLKDAFLSAFGCDTVVELMHRFTARHGRIAAWSLAEVAFHVVAAADGGDRVAREIVAKQATALCRYAAVAADRVGYGIDDDFVISLSGGVLKAPSSPVSALMREKLRELWPLARIVEDAVPPAAGAALMAMVEGGGEPSTSVLERIRQTW